MIRPETLDGQKLTYHTRALQRWLAGDCTWPIYFEIGPAGRCNNRCVFCAYDYLSNQSGMIDAEVLKPALRTLAQHGAKACMYAGEGEPTLHEDLASLVAYTRDLGIEVAITSNFLAMPADLCQSLLGQLTWIRCSLNATNAQEYAAIHRGPKDGFSRVWKNLQQAVAIKRRDDLPVTIGVQCIALEQNVDQLPGFAAAVRDIGVDYLSIKPCIQHPQMSYQVAPVDQQHFDAIAGQVEATSRDGFSVVIRRASISSAAGNGRCYKHCLALPFFGEIISDGRVFACGPHLGDDRFCYGNINEQSFEEIWLGQRRKQICRWAAEELDVSECMPSCRLDQVNSFLWSLKHPPAHVNFI